MTTRATRPFWQRWWAWTIAGVLVLAAIIVLGTIEANNREVAARRVIPDVVGMSIQEAKAALGEVGLEAVTDIDQRASSLDADLLRVESQIPFAGEVGHVEDTVVLQIGPVEVEVPDVVGKMLWDARRTLILEGSFVAAAAPADSAGEWFVEAQDPAPGSRVDAGSSIRLIVTVPVLTVPSVVGMPRGDAEAALRAAGLRVISAGYQPENWIVASQEPAAGASVGPETEVTIEPPKTIVLEVTSNGSIGSVTWTAPGSFSIQQAVETSLPWRIEYPVSANGRGSIVAQNSWDGSGDFITCRIIVNGVVVLENTSTGPYAMVTCNPAR